MKKHKNRITMQIIANAKKSKGKKVAIATIHLANAINRMDTGQKAKL